MHPELVAFCRFLARKGVERAGACIRMLEDEVLPEMDRRMRKPARGPPEPTSFALQADGLGW